MTDSSFAPLRGVLVPLVTPLITPDRIDEAAVDRLVEHIIAGGIDGLFLLGTTGEAPQLGYAARQSLLERASRTAAGRVRVLAGISDCSVDDAVRLAHAAAEAGAEGVFFTPPFYFLLSQDEILRHCESLAKRLPLPYMLYNMPSHARNEFALDTVREIAKWDGCVGIKDSSGNWDYFVKLVEAFRDRKDFSVMTGPEEVLLDALQIGAAGGVAGGGNLAPHWLAGIARAWERGDEAEAARLQTKVRGFGAGIYSVAGGASSYIRGLKCALSLRGLCNGSFTTPFTPVDDAARERIREFLAKEELI